MLEIPTPLLAVPYAAPKSTFILVVTSEDKSAGDSHISKEGFGSG